MKVCLATNQAVALTHGGIRTQVAQTRSALKRIGVEVDLFEMWNPFDASAYDLVHIFSANIATYHFARALRTHGVPFVVSPIFYTRRSPMTMRTVVWLDRIINRFARGIWTDYGIMAEMCGWARAVLPNTEAEAALFSEGLDIDRSAMTVIPNGVEARFASADPGLFVREFGIKDFILCVTHVGPARKNVPRLLEAAEAIDRPLVIIGPIDETPEGREIARQAQKNPKIKLLGPLPHESELLASAYAACDVFVLPSLAETPGIAALEASLAGAKIVITGHGGTREYFGAHAEYVDPTSSMDIRRGISQSLAGPLLRTEGAAAAGSLKALVLERFTWDAVARQTAAVYDRIVQGK